MQRTVFALFFSCLPSTVFPLTTRDQQYAYIIYIGTGGAGQQQAFALFERMVGIVGLQGLRSGDFS